MPVFRFFFFVVLLVRMQIHTDTYKFILQMLTPSKQNQNFVSLWTKMGNTV